MASERSGFEGNFSYSKKQETIQGPVVLSTPRTTMCPYLLEGRKDADVGWRCGRYRMKMWGEEYILYLIVWSP